MSTEFITAKFPDGAVPKTQPAAKAKNRVRRFIPRRDRARVREAGGDWGPFRERPDALERIFDRMDRMGVGPKLIVQRDSDEDQLSVREIDTGPYIPNLGCAPELEKIHAYVWEEFDVRSGGLYLCRNIDGTNTVSRHGYISNDWKGAAEDIFVKSGGMSQLIRVGEYIVNGTKAGVLEAATVIVERRIWTPASGWHAYTGQTHYHVHTDCLGGYPCNP